jgi:hypothetical protein
VPDGRRNAFPVRDAVAEVNRDTHEAELKTMDRVFADVRTTEKVVAMLGDNIMAAREYSASGASFADCNRCKLGGILGAGEHLRWERAVSPSPRRWSRSR